MSNTDPSSLPATSAEASQGAGPGVPTSDWLASVKRSLASAVREYETALMRTPTDEHEIRRAIDKCHDARIQFNLPNDRDEPQPPKN